MPISKKEIKDAMRSVVIIHNGKIFGDDEQMQRLDNCDKLTYPDEWKELYEKHEQDERLTMSKITKQPHEFASLESQGTSLECDNH